MIIGQIIPDPPSRMDNRDGIDWSRHIWLMFETRITWDVSIGFLRSEFVLNILWTRKWRNAIVFIIALFLRCSRACFQFCLAGTWVGAITCVPICAGLPLTSTSPSVSLNGTCSLSSTYLPTNSCSLACPIGYTATASLTGE
jgi:hypothetical protein